MRSCIWSGLSPVPVGLLLARGTTRINGVVIRQIIVSLWWPVHALPTVTPVRVRMFSISDKKPKR